MKVGDIMTHIFIVNDTTFKYHLEYMFAGTGANCDAPFLENANYQNPRKKEKGLTSISERNIVAMVADISRIREGDKVIFYLQASKHEGKFYGVFKMVGGAFYDSNDNNYLSIEMGKKLNLRVMIEADEVYPLGVSEHTALDLLDGINHPSQMCWSLIYRKLKGNRGCTMITDYESGILISKIRAANNYQALRGVSFSFDVTNERIVETSSAPEYKGDKKSVQVKERLIVKYNRGNAFEAHLQAYIVQNCLKKPLSDLLEINNELPAWVGNEVSCGVGMQRIDIVISQEDDNTAIVNIVELKDECPYDGIITYQLPWYIKWVMNYWAPLYSGKELVINPIVIAKKDSDERTKNFKILASSLVYSDLPSNVKINPVRYIAFSMGEDISFIKVF